MISTVLFVFLVRKKLLFMKTGNNFICFLQAVHSSGAIRSDSTLDSRELCGSVSCKTISLVYEKATSKWLNFIATIPIGALDIEISEIQPSSNVLLLKSINNTYVINGHGNESSPPGTFNYFDDTFDYSIEDNLENITSKGPLQNAFDLLVRFLFLLFENTRICQIGIC